MTLGITSFFLFISNPDASSHVHSKRRELVTQSRIVGGGGGGGGELAGRKGRREVLVKVR